MYVAKSSCYCSINLSIQNDRCSNCNCLASLRNFGVVHAYTTLIGRLSCLENQINYVYIYINEVYNASFSFKL